MTTDKLSTLRLEVDATVKTIYEWVAMNAVTMEEESRLFVWARKLSDATKRAGK